VTDIVLPAELKPADGRFGCGPSRVRPEQLAALAASGDRYLGTSHRQAPVRSLVQRAREGLAALFGVPDGYQVVLGNGGTTAFWEIAAFGLIRQKSQHLAFGEFSAKFAQAATAATWLDDPTVIASPPGTHPVPSGETGVDTYALTHNETSTGVAMPVRRVPGAIDRPTAKPGRSSDRPRRAAHKRARPGLVRRRRATADGSATFRRAGPSRKPRRKRSECDHADPWRWSPRCWRRARRRPPPTSQAPSRHRAEVAQRSRVRPSSGQLQRPPNG